MVYILDLISLEACGEKQFKKTSEFQVEPEIKISTFLWSNFLPLPHPQNFPGSTLEKTRNIYILIFSLNFDHFLPEFLGITKFWKMSGHSFLIFIAQKKNYSHKDSVIFLLTLYQNSFLQEVGMLTVFLLAVSTLLFKHTIIFKIKNINYFVNIYMWHFMFSPHVMTDTLQTFWPEVVLYNLTL